MLKNHPLETGGGEGAKREGKTFRIAIIFTFILYYSTYGHIKVRISVLYIFINLSASLNL
jgi:hypothetical protein